MKNNIRGSEKLKNSCTDLAALSLEEMEIVAGGLSISNGFALEAFPRGIPWPEWFSKASLIRDQIIVESTNPIEDQVVFGR